MATKTAKKPTKKYTVKAVGIVYTEPTTRYNTITGQDVEVQARKRRGHGQTVELPDDQARRLLDLDAIVPLGEDASPSQAVPVNPDALGETASEKAPENVPLSEFTDEELVLWLQGEGQEKPPNIKQVLHEIGNDPVVAARVREAEGEASGGEPRSTLIEELEKLEAGD